jgi:colicin import membrane protein
MTQADLLESGTDIVAVVEANPVMVLTDRQKFNQFYEAIKRETDALEADVSTEKGRKAIKSMAFKVAQTKTAIDDAGKKLNEDARSRINAIDEARREIRQQLDALKEEVRRPVTEWEKAEDARIDECKKTLTLLRDSAVVGYEENAADVRKRVDHVAGLTFDPVQFEGYAAQCEALKDQTVAALSAAIERLEREEAERAELEKLRAEAAEREAREAAEREERERAERARIEAEAAERRRKEAEEAEARRIKEAEERAAQAAREEAEHKAREEADAREAALQAQLAEERRQREDAERVAAARKAEEERAAAEQAKRDADQKHRTEVKTAAKQAIMSHGASEDVAKAIVLAIIAGEIPHVSIRF